MKVIKSLEMLCAFFLGVIVSVSCYAGEGSVLYLHFNKSRIEIKQRINRTEQRIPIKIFRNLVLDDKAWEYFNLKSESHRFQNRTIDTGLVFIDLAENLALLKDMEIVEKELYIEKSNLKFIKLNRTVRIDSIMRINPLTLTEELVILSNNVAGFSHDFGDMSFQDFSKAIKMGDLFIETNSKSYFTTAISLYYQSESSEGVISLQYPNPDTFELRKLKFLEKGGSVWLDYLNFPESISNSSLFVSGYISIGNPSARLQNEVKPDFQIRVIKFPVNIDDKRFWDSIIKLPQPNNIPDPTPTINGKFYGGNISLESIITASGLFIQPSQMGHFPVRFDVISFRISVTGSGKKIVVTANGPLFSVEMTNVLKSLKKGDEVLFDEIIVKGTDKRVRKLSSMVFKIT
jgi:hypothetical protein